MQKQLRLLPKGPPDFPTPPASRTEFRPPKSWRTQTINMRKASKRAMERERVQLELLELEDPIGDIARPRTRGDCAAVVRPCPFISCKHHLYLDVSPRTGAIKLNFPDIDPDEMPAARSCALDVADETRMRGEERTLEEVGVAMNVTRERVRQLETSAIARLRAVRDLRELRAVDGEESAKHRLPLYDPEPLDELELDPARFASDDLGED